MDCRYCETYRDRPRQYGAASRGTTAPPLITKPAAAETARLSGP